GIEATSARSEGPREIVLKSENQEPDRIVISVCDSGVGIDPANADQIFNPFFTNKSGGMGESLDGLIRSVGLAVRTFRSAQEFLRSQPSSAPACLVLDVRLPGLSG